MFDVAAVIAAGAMMVQSMNRIPEDKSEGAVSRFLRRRRERKDMNRLRAQQEEEHRRFDRRDAISRQRELEDRRIWQAHEMAKLREQHRHEDDQARKIEKEQRRLEKEQKRQLRASQPKKLSLRQLIAQAKEQLRGELHIAELFRDQESRESAISAAWMRFQDTMARLGQKL